MIRATSLFLGLLLLTGAAIRPEKPENLPPAEAAKQGRALVSEILAQQPARSITNSGVLTISRGRASRSVPIQFTVEAGGDSWRSTYKAFAVSNSTPSQTLIVKHDSTNPNQYELIERIGTDTNAAPKTLEGNETMIPFAGSDFWIADLGLEFFHWPDQRLLRSEIKRSRSCRVLESINPKPAPGVYSRVVSWIDNESSGIVHADAYDFNGKVLKQFDPKDFKKVDGEWQLEGMEIYDRVSDSRTRIEFNLDSR